MRSSSVARSIAPALFVAALSAHGGCAAFADLPEYKLAPGGGGQGGGGQTAGGRSGSAGDNVGGQSAGTGGGKAGTGGGSGAGGGGGTAGKAQGGAAGNEPGGEGGAEGGGEGGAENGGEGGSGGGESLGGKAGAAGKAGDGGGTSGASGTGGAGGTSGSSGKGGNGGSSGKSGASGSAGAAGGTGGISGQAGAGGIAGASGVGGAAGGSAGQSGAAGDGGQGGAPTTFPVETIAGSQFDPGTLLLESGVLYWVNKNGGATGQVRSLALPGVPASMATPNTVLQNSDALTDIAFLNGRLFVLRGTGDLAQPILTSYAPDGSGPLTVQDCTDGVFPDVLTNCVVTSVNRLVRGQTKVFFSGKAVGGSGAAYTGIKSCTSAANGCAGAQSGPVSPALATAGDTLFFVDPAAPTKVRKLVGTTASDFFTAPSSVADLASDGTTVFAIAQGGEIVSQAASGTTLTTVLASGAGASPQRLAIAGGFVYWTALGPASGQGIVGRVKVASGEMDVLAADRTAPVGVVVDTSKGVPHVYFSDKSNEIQRIRLVKLPS